MEAATAQAMWLDVSIPIHLERRMQHVDAELQGLGLPVSIPIHLERRMQPCQKPLLGP